jgi:hypothetical protein
LVSGTNTVSHEDESNSRKEQPMPVHPGSFCTLMFRSYLMQPAIPPNRAFLYSVAVKVRGSRIPLVYRSRALLIFVFTSAAFAAQGHLAIDTDEYHYEATFDSDRISEGRLRELLPFSPYLELGENWKLDNLELTIGGEQTPTLLEKSPLANSLEVCIANDRRYRPCGKRDISDPNFFVNAQINVEANAKAAAMVDHLQVPTELVPILEHFREALAFYSTLQRRRLEYLRAGDLAVLSMPIGSIDPSTACTAELKQLERATTLPERYSFSRYSWHNCLNREWLRISPGYSTSAWHNFIVAYGIDERFTEKTID